MKPASFSRRLAGLLLGLLPFAALAGSAPVTRVVLHPGAALIERTATIRAGDSRLEIDGLPAGFDVDAVQVEADTGIEIGEMVWRDRTRDAPLNAAEARLEKAVRDLTARIALLDAELGAAERELRYLDALASPGEGLHAGNPAKVLETLRQGSLSAQRKVFEIEQRKEPLERELQALQQDLERVRPPVAQVRALSLRLQARRDGQIRLRYLLTDAGWRPAYRARLDSESGRLEVERIARIAQRSGEDWQGVRLSLSTGQPTQRAAGPLPNAWNLSLQAEERLERRAMMADAMPVMAPAPMLAKTAGGGQPLFEAEATHGEFATLYDIPGRIDLPADGRKVTVALARQTLPVELSVQLAPRLDPAGYLMVRGELPEGVWPAGEVQLYRDGAQVGSMHWDPARDEHLSLPFGRDERLRVKVRNLAADSSRAGFVGQQAARHLADRFTVTSLHRQAIQLRVLDAAPVARDSQIEVEADFQPPVSQRDWAGRSGVVAWAMTLPGGESRDFTADYRIRWPKERRIIGLP